jgi:hypothetical protein
MTITFKSEYRLIKFNEQARKTNHVLIPPNTYPCHLEPNPLGFSGQWLIIDEPFKEDGVKVGASLNSMTQWAGEGWEEYEVILIDDKGERVVPEAGLFTWEKVGQRIAEGLITNPRIIEQYNKLKTSN